MARKPAQAPIEADAASQPDLAALVAAIEGLTIAQAFARPVMTTEEAAAYLSMSVQNLELLRLNGDGPLYAKLGRLVRYRRRSLDAWLAENERRHTAEAAR